MTTVGITYTPPQPPERLLELAHRAETAGLDDLWLWEDCFSASGLGPAAAVLGATARIRVGVGLMPVPLRNVALTAMELSALSRMFPGRLMPGVGHGVLEWMGQVGARVDSPVTLLREYTSALQRLLGGESVTVDGRYIRLDAVQLDWPTTEKLPLYVGARGPKSVAVAAQFADGWLYDLGEPSRLEHTLRDIRMVRAEEGNPADFHVVSNLGVPCDIGASALADRIAALSAAGADTVAVFGNRAGTESGFDPDGSEAVFGLLDTVAEARRQLA